MKYQEAASYILYSIYFQRTPKRCFIQGSDALWNRPTQATFTGDLLFHTFQNFFSRRLRKYKQTTGFTIYSGYLFRRAKSLLNYRFPMILMATFYQDPTVAFLEPLTQMSDQTFSRDIIFVIWPVNIMHPRNYHKLKSKY